MICFCLNLVSRIVNGLYHAGAPIISGSVFGGKVTDNINNRKVQVMKHSEKLKILFLCTGNSCPEPDGRGLGEKV